ncbi:hypothetical protein Hdeb2414_s0377g00880681 [Helianthus debilis subsp. tardiflorus]
MYDTLAPSIKIKKCFTSFETIKMNTGTSINAQMVSIGSDLHGGGTSSGTDIHILSQTNL